MNTFAANDTAGIAAAISDIPASDLHGGPEVYDVQSDKCRVWVDETLTPGTPLVTISEIVFPYFVRRGNHRYNCVDKKLKSGHTTKAVDADINSKVTASYQITSGKLIISNIQDHGKTDETIGGGAIVKHLSLFS